MVEENRLQMAGETQYIGSCQAKGGSVAENRYFLDLQNVFIF
ncbi:hypothetical protein BN1221_01806c [Brenneria goodwinii]|uniref:Uncharacterized protein n=1 Tax=Brenneria goodwinii TaxID=1109412 RepID=A0A0G4JU10_9GAMM|nr:hypothetical protein BN1221_01806c [Brenneria goodwinii]